MLNFQNLLSDPKFIKIRRSYVDLKKIPQKKCSEKIFVEIFEKLKNRNFPLHRKNRFFWFFQNGSKITLNIEFCFKITLTPPKGQFLAIFHHISHYKHLEKNRFFFDKNHDFCFFFWDFLNFDDATDYSAGTGQKYGLWPEMHSLDP